MALTPKLLPARSNLRLAKPRYSVYFMPFFSLSARSKAPLISIVGFLYSMPMPDILKDGVKSSKEIPTPKSSQERVKPAILRTASMTMAISASSFCSSYWKPICLSENGPKVLSISNQTAKLLLVTLSSSSSPPGANSSCSSSACCGLIDKLKILAASGNPNLPDKLKPLRTERLASLLSVPTFLGTGIGGMSFSSSSSSSSFPSLSGILSFKTRISLTLKALEATTSRRDGTNSSLPTSSEIKSPTTGRDFNLILVAISKSRTNSHSPLLVFCSFR